MTLQEDRPAGAVPLSQFPGIPFEYIMVLRSLKINTSREFLPACRDPIQRLELSKDTGIPEVRLMEMAALAGIAEIPGLGPVTARLLYEAGAKSVEQLKKAETGALYQQCRKIIRERKYDREPPAEQEIAHWISEARSIRE